MHRRDFVAASALGSLSAGTAHLRLDSLVASRSSRKILIAGGGFRTAFIRYMATLTGKKRLRICYLPTASADSDSGKLAFFKDCAPLNVEPHVQDSFIESLSQKEGWDEVFLSMDAIVVSGGNTLNQQAIWKAQGIDTVLRRAWDQGIVLGGASAGSLCWFEEGTTDSRPRELSIVKCLGFLPGSHSPHYDAEVGRRRRGLDQAGWLLHAEAGHHGPGARPLPRRGRQGGEQQRAGGEEGATRHGLHATGSP